MIEITDLSKTYRMGESVVNALDGVSFRIDDGELVAIMGPSGSGKSTLMNVIGCLDVPSSGSYKLDGIEVSGLDGNALAALRNRHIGFVFQSFNLLPRLTALQNVELPLIYAGLSGAERRRWALAALAAVGLSDRVDHRPKELSGGQQQRVAIARALVGQPSLILADEPTGNLDSRTSLEIMAIFQRLNREQQITIVFVTHELEIAHCTRRILRMRDGRIERDEPVLETIEAGAAVATVVGGRPAGEGRAI
jgi:putative ABC transport system ATP-binding protein